MELKELQTAKTRRLEKILQKAESWREKHGAQFEVSKYTLIHFTRNRWKTTEASVKVNKTTIEPSSEAKYLGVTFDQKLLFKTHLQIVTKKRTKTVMTFIRIIKCNWRTSYKYARQLFNTIVVTQMNYTINIWHWSRNKGEIAVIIQTWNLIKIQRLIMKTIIKCYKIISTIVMKIEIDLQSI